MRNDCSLPSKLNNKKDLRSAHTSTSQVFSFQAVSFPLRRLGRLCVALTFAERSSRGLLGDALGGEALARRFGSCEPLLTVTRKSEFQLVLVLRSVNILDACGGAVFEEVRKAPAVKHDLSNSDTEFFFPRFALLLLQPFKV